MSVPEVNSISSLESLRIWLGRPTASFPNQPAATSPASLHQPCSAPALAPGLARPHPSPACYPDP
ncbi:hypothetical protein SLEP1_g55643 [Rubroshorea leprosula]|uniref:Uncharacterized protein n=1 Tax=Rubroshorea leprosula TaxID=152421 RepID=A0AAV5MK77_9ROSI|nr:hypothetical protein SLEP1_g55643 [Rubroshorea leprosula]